MIGVLSLTMVEQDNAWLLSASHCLFDLESEMCFGARDTCFPVCKLGTSAVVYLKGLLTIKVQ